MLNKTLVALAAAAVVVIPTAAVAGTGDGGAKAEPIVHSVFLKDGAADVWQHSETTDWMQVDLPYADVLNARVTFEHDAIRTKMFFEDLRHVNTAWYGVTVRTDAKDYKFTVEARKINWKGDAFIKKGGDWVKAPYVVHRINYSKNFVVIKVPRAKLGMPDTVQVRMRNDFRDGRFFYTDNPHNLTAFPGWTRVLDRS